MLTLHRPSNVDDKGQLEALLRAICAAAQKQPIVFPVHPRTAKSIESIGFSEPNLHFVEPQPYLEFNYLVQHATAVVTDSGGVTEETTVMNVPCMTLRDSTECPETIEWGTNELLGTDPRAIAPAFERLFEGKWKQGTVPELWDGRAGERIVLALEDLLSSAPAQLRQARAPMNRERR